MVSFNDRCSGCKVRLPISSHVAEKTMEHAHLWCFLYSGIFLLVVHDSYALDLQVRLVNGSSEREGRVEVRRGRGAWGRVCADGFDNRDASVVCRQLGLGTSGEAREAAYFGVGPGLIYLDGALCDGTESRLSDCYLYGLDVQACHHHKSAGVVCLEKHDLPSFKEHHCPRGFFGYRCNFPCRCYGDDNCNTVTGTCPRGCLSGFWGPGCQLADRCYYNGQPRSYMGNMNRTADGTRCQDWRSQAPQEHSYTPDHFPDARFPNNYCRVTADSQKAWCYRIRNPRWGYCDVVNCACPAGMFGHNCGQMCHCKDRTEDCNRILGHCQSGCDEGWTGFDCQTPVKPKQLAESNKTRTLRKLAKARVTAQTGVQIRSVLEQQGETSAADVVLVADVLSRAAELSNISPKMAIDLLKIVNLVAELNQTVLQQSNTVGNTTNRLIMAVEQLADRVSLEEGEVRLETNSTVLYVWDMATASQPSFWGLQLLTDGRIENVSSVSSLSDPDSYANMVAAVMLPGKIIRQLLEVSPGRDVRLSASVTRQTSLFQAGPEPETADTYTCWNRTSGQTAGDRSEGQFRLGNHVVSLRITVEGRPITDLSAFAQGHVISVFQPLQALSLKSSSEVKAGSQCVFWDVTLEQGQGGWSMEGCHLDKVLSGRVICRCDHLTHFAALMDISAQGVSRTPVREYRLTIVTMVGLVFAICALSLTLLFILLVKKLRKSLPQQTLFNTELATLLSWLTFLTGITSLSNHVTCVAVAMLLHYLILVSFLWTLAQGVLYYVILVKGRAQPAARFMLKAAALAWGLPLIPVLILSAIDVELYRGERGYCWMSSTPFYDALVEPLVLIVVITIVLYVLTMVRLCCGSVISSSDSGYSATSACVSFGCFCLLVLGWVFAFFTVEDAHQVFQYLFACTTALHGLLVFVMFTVRDPAVQAFCLNIFCRGRKGLENDASAIPHVRMSREAVYVPSP